MNGHRRRTEGSENSLHGDQVSGAEGAGGLKEGWKIDKFATGGRGGKVRLGPSRAREDASSTRSKMFHRLQGKNILHKEEEGALCHWDSQGGGG